MDSKKIYINDDFRPLWDIKKKQLLIDSIFNHYDIQKIYTVLMEDDTFQIVKSREIMSTIHEFSNDAFAVADDFTFDNLPNEQLGGKKFSEMSDSINACHAFMTYLLDIIVIKGDYKSVLGRL